MDISVVDGCNKDLATWSWVCPPEIDKDVRADEGDGEIAAEEHAARTGTIAYDVLCRIGARVPRVYSS